MISIFRKPKAYIVFSSEYLVGVSTYGDHNSFDIYKYKRIRDQLITDKLLKLKHILYPQPCSYNDINLVHTNNYIRKIKDPVFVNQALKIEVNSVWDNTVLEYYKAVCGGTVFAAFNAISLGKPVFNLGGGFHHAQPDKAEGFCLLNDIAIAIRKIKLKTEIKNILIVDLDYHQGNGNTKIFKDDASVFTFSIHADCWNKFDAVANLDVLVSSDLSDREYLRQIRLNLKEVLSSFKADLIFYIAGSDPYKGDNLADMKISRKAMLQRNVYILSKAREHKIPIVVLPGGGYGPDSWLIYYEFIKAALKGVQ
ncbi:MAG: histone deacetylase [Calditrichae bacterium]|nr:histone deacetylase [Calditrichota bacterium]MCB9057127.1 histone deacetylase [Calditrichia bacterium]